MVRVNYVKDERDVTGNRIKDELRRIAKKYDVNCTFEMTRYMLRADFKKYGYGHIHTMILTDEFDPDNMIKCLTNVENELIKKLRSRNIPIPKHNDDYDAYRYIAPARGAGRSINRPFFRPFDFDGDVFTTISVPVLMPSIKNVIFNEPATIVIWADGTKTVVKAQDGEEFDPEKGLAMAISKKALGNEGNYFETFKEWIEYEEEESEAEKLLAAGEAAMADINEGLKNAAKKISTCLTYNMSRSPLIKRGGLNNY